jgi:hypothetical protein
MASRFLPGFFAAVPSVFPARLSNLIFYKRPLLPPPWHEFLAKFELSIIPSKQQVLLASWGRTFTKASTNSFISHWNPKTTAAVAALPPQVQQLLEEFLSLLRPNPTPPKPLHGVRHHMDRGSAAPVFAHPGGWTRKNTA